ncbi:hypothetical protein JQK87_06940 [Streptomyces sp. G44]|uniref:hypothetical protein n=1 Tax=Streptomyces sp. G44 TaxID=2807632 RepID=UPI0019600FC4|nr:hypothetical protein [Streptomyces sp. G44]MBM7168146.1 hypothetical protein [Streptomyces sp. G44]
MANSDDQRDPLALPHDRPEGLERLERLERRDPSSFLDRPIEITDPVLAVRHLTRYELPGRRHLGRPDCALVLAGAGDTYETYIPPRRPAGLRGHTAVYEVDMGVHPLCLRIRLPSAADSFQFDTTFDLTWQVVDPEQFVVSHERDVPALLNRVLQRLMRPTTRMFPISSSAAAELSVQKLLDTSTDIAAHQGLRMEGTARLERDPALRQLEQEQSLRAKKIAFYRHHLARGGLSALLLHLSEHPQDTHLVVDCLRADELKQVENQLQLIDRVLPDGPLEKYQLEEPQQLVLALFRSALTQVRSGPHPREDPPLKSVAPLPPVLDEQRESPCRTAENP